MTPDGEPGLNYLCAGYMRFFRHMDEPARVIVELIRTGREASEVMAFMAEKDAGFAALVAAAGRNDPCPCGSGLKTKRCHGAPEEPVPVDLSGIPLGIPRPPVAKSAK